MRLIVDAKVKLKYQHLITKSFVEVSGQKGRMGGFSAIATLGGSSYEGTGFGEEERSAWVIERFNPYFT